VRRPAPLAGLLVKRFHIGGHQELRLERPAKVLLRELDLFHAERFTVRLGGVLLVWRTKTNVITHGDQRRSASLGLGGNKSSVDGGNIVAVDDPLDMPAIRLEARADVFGKSQVRGAVDSDVVVIVENDELAQLLMTGKRRSLAADPLHHVAIAGENVREVIHNCRSSAVEGGTQEALGYGHANCVGKALAERTSGRFDANRMTVFRMAGRLAAPLTKRTQIVEAQVIASQVQKRIEEQAAVTS
jgi:hypothetical protein